MHTTENAALSVRRPSVDDQLPPTLQARYEEVERVYDTIEEELDLDFRYQLPSIRHLALVIYRHGGAADLSDTGVGKTGVACGVAKTLGLDLFVVCPKAVIPPWRRMAEVFDIKATVINYEAMRTGNNIYGYAWKERVETKGGVKFYKRFQWDALGVDPEGALIVFDDCHKMKDYKTWNCLMGLRAIEQGYPVLGASATAADNPMHMKFIGLLTGLFDEASHFWGWMCEHGVRKGKWGMEFRGSRKILADIHRRILPARGSRIRVADLGDRFPGTQIISEAYDMGEKETHEIQAIYAQMRREIARLEATMERDSAAARASILVQILRARQRAELLKVPTLAEMTLDAVAEGSSVPLFLNFQESITAARRLVGMGTPSITGADTDRERQIVIDRFNTDQEHIVIVNIKAGGVGVSLQGTASGRPRLALISPTYSAIDFKQALGRVHRAGGRASVQKVVFAAGTVEEQACAKVRRKLRNIDTLNDGDLAV